MPKDALFRKKSVDRITSPEQMRDYLRVTSPKLWMLLSAIILLLAGLIFYAATSRMESTYPLKMTFYAWDYLTGEIPYDQMDHFSVGMPVRIGGETGSVKMVFSGARMLLNISLDSQAELEDGYYYLSFGESTEADPDDMYYLICDSGRLTCSDMAIQNQASGGDARVRIWDDASLEEGTQPINGRLATITGAEPIAIAEVAAELDSAETALEMGMYDAEIVTENTTPLSFLLN